VRADVPNTGHLHPNCPSWNAPLALKEVGCDVFLGFKPQAVMLRAVGAARCLLTAPRIRQVGLILKTAVKFKQTRREPQATTQRTQNQ
jgi:hypothetical protein